MKHSSRPIISFAASLFAAALLLSGCGTKPEPRAYTVRVALDPTLAGSSIQVDIVGANELADLPQWRTYSVTEYWQPNNAFRRDARKVALEFGRGRPQAQVLAATDPRWSEWLRTGAAHLILVADLPGVTADAAGSADPRRLILPLDRNLWPRNTETIEVLVQESGLRLLTAQRP